MENKKTKTYKKTGQSAYQSIPELIAVGLLCQIETRDNAIKTEFEHVVFGMNFSLLLTINSMIEGFIEDLLTDVVNTYKFYKSFEQTNNNDAANIEKQYILRLNEEIRKQIEKGTWSKLKELSKLILNKSFDELVSKEVINSMNHQFMLRNMIAHRNTIRAEFLMSEENERKLEFNKKYQQVFNYLRGPDKLIPKEHETNYILPQIFTTKVTNHFIINSIKFLIELEESFKNSSSKPKQFYILKYLENVRVKYDI